VASVAMTLDAATSIAAAADMPARAPVLKAPPPIGYRAMDWSGFYIGAHGGFGSSQFRGTFADSQNFGAFDFPVDGAVAGAQVGYLWQFGRVVYGVEIDGSWANLNGSVTNDGIEQELKTNFLGSARFRSGVTIDNVLLYTTAGLAYGRSKFSASGDLQEPGSVKLNDWGFVGGLGLEWAFAPNWSLRGEYLYYRFDTFDDDGKDISNLTSLSNSTDFAKLDAVHVGRVALNYRFNGSGGGTVMSEPITNWAGFYAGAHAGYVRSRITGAYDERGEGQAAFSEIAQGFAGGAQAGYNFQSGAWVYGIEGDASWSNADKHRSRDFDDDEQTLKTDVFASLRGRVGITSSDTLYYLTAGVGYVRSQIEGNEGDGDSGSFKRNFNTWGAVIGGGIDWRFSPAWSARVESLTFLGSDRHDTSNISSDADPQDFFRQSTVTMIRAGVNYHFPVGGIVAKY
jgi:outer membrane immunogenic protein